MQDGGCWVVFFSVEKNLIYHQTSSA